MILQIPMSFLQEKIHNFNKVLDGLMTKEELKSCV